MTTYSIFGGPTGQNPRVGNGEVDEDDQTVMASENRSSFARETREICLKWVFPYNGDKKKALLSHFSMLEMMLKAFPDLVIIDNKAREHTDRRTLKPTEQHRPFEFYADNRNQKRRSLICIHRVRTEKSLAELKDSWGVYEELKKQKAYVRTHAFGEKDREISHIGFIPGVSMLNVPKEVAKDELIAMLKQDHEEIPRFEVVQVSVDMGKGSKSSERTRAYEIQCLQRDASRLAKMLQTGVFKEKPVYIPYHIKRSKPGVFKRAIKRQIKTLADQWVIKLQGFTMEMIDSVRDKILESWAQSIVPTKNAATRGEWKILVDRENHSVTLGWLKENWVEILDLMPAETADASPYDRPRIATRNHHNPEPESEEGTVDTYGTVLSSLYYGSDNEDSESARSESEPPSENQKQRPLSYAQVTRDGNISTVSQGSGWTEQRNDEFAKLHEKHTQLEENFKSVTAELCELKEMLQQLLSQGKSQNDIEPPSKKQATFETPKRSDRSDIRHWLQPSTMELEYGSGETDPEAGKSS